MRFDRSRHPYYIFATDFRLTSGGSVALHRLCDALNASGESAYLLNATVTQPGLNVRFLSTIQSIQHRLAGLVPIVVYPEIISDNPCGGRAVVRYMLNRDGLLTGRRIEPQGAELRFYHSTEFVPDGMVAPEILQVPVLDENLFAPPAAGGNRTRSYLLIDRVDRADIDFAQLPSDVEILDSRNPRPLAELVPLFQAAAVLYSYEISGTCVCALLAGCPVLYVRNRRLAKIPNLGEFSTDGTAFIDEVGGLERARATVAKVREHCRAVRERFPAQLQNFVGKTQAFAESIGQSEARPWWRGRR